MAGGTALRRPKRRGRPAPAGADQAYDAFISYSHAVDGQLAPAVQSALHGFVKPWYRTHPVRAFRDQSSLSANPALWASIERALQGSRYFILLASPKAAASPWVDREVAWWLANKGRETLLIALTAGELAWDPKRRVVEPTATTALPPALVDTPAEEPRYVDLRWAAGTVHLSMRDPRFRVCWASVKG